MTGEHLFEFIASRVTQRGKQQNKRFGHSKVDMDGLWKHITVRPEEEFFIEFRHRLSKTTNWFLGPIAFISVRSGHRAARLPALGLRFFIEDPKLTQAGLQLLEHSFDADVSHFLIIEFSHPDHSYRDLFARLMEPSPSYQFRQPLVARLGVQSGRDVVYSCPLEGGVLAAGLGREEGKNFYIFDCHSHWHLSPFETECHGWVCSDWSTPKKTCGCVDTDLKVKTTCSGWRCCFCDSWTGPILAPT